MTLLRGLGRGTLILPMLGILACTSAPRDGVVTTDADNRHGFVVGDSIAPFAVHCLSGRSRMLGELGATQLVTFSTAGDCSTCMPHLDGLEQIARAGRGPPDSFILTWAPGQSIAEVGRLYASRPARDVCLDKLGQAWDSLDLQHSPVTVLLISGRVSYMTDRGYLTDSSRARFLADLAGVSSQAR
jgi:hypothetical protein